MDTLTKENFWDEMSQKYPKAVKHFGEWVDQYKENDTSPVFKYIAAPKYHELPIAMQFGIFLKYTSVVANEIRGKGMTFRVIIVLTGNYGRTIRKKITSFLIMREAKL